MSMVRLRRLKADYEVLREFVRRQPRVRLIQSEGDPPERYQLEYQIRGMRQVDEQLQMVNSHMVEIALPLNYPRMPPQCRMLTPIFHPNIAPHAICIGDHWAAGEPLWSMVARIGEMIAYQSYNVKSPLNGEAARWVEQNVSRLPLDPIVLSVFEASAAPGQPPPLPPAPPPPAPPRPSLPMATPLASPAAQVVIACPGCQTRYKVPPQATARRVRCKKCQGIIEVPAGSPPR
jgi:ubiquitin-protein ligase